MSKKEIKIKNPDKIVEIVEMILKFNKQNQQGTGLKILTHIKCLVDYQFL